MSDSIGATTWVFPGGNIPDSSTGHEPEFTSRDEICMINTSDRDAEITIDVYFDDRDPSRGYRCTVAGARVCHLWVNDFIDPEAVPLGVPYGLVIRSSVPIVVQLSRLDTRHGGVSTTMTPGFFES